MGDKIVSHSPFSETKSKKVSEWKKLIREMFQAELAAMEAYEKVLNFYDLSATDLKRLRKIYEDHEYASQYWQHCITGNGNMVQHASGGWGLIVGRLLPMSGKLSLRTTLMGLIAGEKISRSRYSFLLTHEVVPSEIKKRIREHFMPNQTEHIEALKGLISLHPELKRAN